MIKIDQKFTVKSAILLVSFFRFTQLHTYIDNHTEANGQNFCKTSDSTATVVEKTLTAKIDDFCGKKIWLQAFTLVCYASFYSDID